MWGHTGSTFGYTQFMAASPNGKRSATVSINSQLTQSLGNPLAFTALRYAEERAVCAALAGKDCRGSPALVLLATAPR